MFIIINKCQFFSFMQEFFDEEIKMKFLFIKLFIPLNNPNKLFTISEVKAVVKSWKEDVAERFLYQARNRAKCTRFLHFKLCVRDKHSVFVDYHGLSLPFSHVFFLFRRKKYLPSSRTQTNQNIHKSYQPVL